MPEIKVYRKEEKYCIFVFILISYLPLMANKDFSYSQLEAGYLIECITHAGLSIAFLHFLTL